MRSTLCLTRREFAAYFLSPVGYLVPAVFLFALGLQFSRVLDLLTASGPRGVEYPVRALLGDEKFWIVFLFIPPLLTMRLFAEERASGTLELLLTAPLRDWQVVAGKYLACLAFYAVLWLPTAVYLPALLDLDWQTFQPRLDPGPVAATYLGLALAGAMFLAIGLLVSSLVKSQLIAALVSMAVGMVFVLAGIVRPEAAPDEWPGVAAYLSVPLHFGRDLTRGVVDSRPVVLYLSVAAFCLFLTVRSLERRRWR